MNSTPLNMTSSTSSRSRRIAQTSRMPARISPSVLARLRLALAAEAQVPERIDARGEDHRLHRQRGGAPQPAPGAAEERADRLHAELHHRHPGDRAHQIAAGHLRQQRVACGHHERRDRAHAQGERDERGVRQVPGCDDDRERSGQERSDEMEPDEHDAPLVAVSRRAAEQQERQVGSMPAIWAVPTRSAAVCSSPTSSHE
jgi:hypothetical protein